MIVSISKGVAKKVSPRQVKKTIMEANNWSEEQYKKQYDIFKLKVRSFEALEKSMGRTREKQSPVEIMYKMAMAKKRYGDDYQPSKAIARILQTSAYSTKNMARAMTQRQQQKYWQFTLGNMAKFIEKNALANQIANDTSLTFAQREERLVALAKKLHLEAKRARKMKRVAEEYGVVVDEIAFGEVYGSM